MQCMNKFTLDFVLLLLAKTPVVLIYYQDSLIIPGSALLESLCGVLNVDEQNMCTNHCDKQFIV